MKTAPEILLVFLASASCVAGQEKHDLKQLLKEKGPPAFTASAVAVRGTLLVCEGMSPLEPGNAKAPEAYAGRVLLFCDAWDSLWIGIAATELKMTKAVPLLGDEKPGVKFKGLAPVKGSTPCELISPARVWAAFVDKQGKLRMTAECTVKRLALVD